MHIINIGKLVGIDQGKGILKGHGMNKLESIEDAWIEVQDGKIVSFGPMSEKSDFPQTTVDALNQLVLPSFIDCHTHTVFAQGREEEFVDRIKGLSYEEIAERGGGILNSAQKLQNMSEDELYEGAKTRLQKMMSCGTGAVEIKSGYGLDLENELKMLRVIKRLKENLPIPVRSTFLGAHALPAEYKSNKTAYIDEVVNNMLPEIASQSLADYIDVFCEQGYFDLVDTERIVLAAAKYEMKARLHVNQFNSFGAIRLSQKLDVFSVEHLEVLTEEDLTILQNSEIIPVSLPACSFYLSIPYTPVRDMIDRGLPIVLATDFNPGSSPISDLHFVLSLASIKQKMLPEEAINAVTINAAHALELESEVGSIAVGKRANLNFYSIDSINQIPYYPAAKLIQRVMINGEFL